MPVYTFYCPTCKETTEIEQKMSDPRTGKVCKKCSSALEIQIQPTTFHLHGPGWYVTDYKPTQKEKKGKKKGD